MKERIRDASYVREMSSRLQAMRSGHEVQRDEVLDLHSRLSRSISKRGHFVMFKERAKEVSPIILGKDLHEKE